MFKKYNAMTICVDKDHYPDCRVFVDVIKDVKSIHIYATEDKDYIGFEVKSTACEIAKLIEQQLYKAKTEVVGGLIFVEFK